jgi:hypothetical protein
MRLTDNALHQVEALAAHRGCTLSDVLRDALASTTTSPPLETCARTRLHHLDQRFAGLENFVLRSATGRPVAERLEYRKITH